jgi:Ala-tRNA(Pro) deacylase
MKNIIQQIYTLLDEKNIRYLSISHSDAYSKNEIAINDYNLGNKLVDSVLIKINNKETVMLVVPSTRKISLVSLQKVFNNTNIDFIGKKEMAKLFPEFEAGTMPPLGCLYDMPIYCVAEIQKMQEVTFYTGTSAHRIRLKTADFFNVIQPKAYINVTTTSRYRAETQAVVPLDKKQSFGDHQHCILGFSLENKNFSTAKLVGMFDWVCRYFKNCTLLIGDGIHRHTLETQGMDANYSHDKALRLGLEVIENNKPVIQAHRDSCNITIVLCSEIQKTKSYQQHYQNLTQLFNRSLAFADCLRDFANTFVDRRNLTREEININIEKSCLYLLEELAVFTTLSEQGCKVFVYPGALRALTEIAEGLHLDAPKALKELICVELKIKRCGAS